MIKKFWLVAIACAALSVRCADSPSTAAGREAERDMKVSADVWGRVRQTRLFFGHQSVGENILDGVRDLARGAGNSDIHIIDRAKEATPAGPVLLHAHIGQNGDPLSKIRGFREALDSGVGEQVDVAAMKFCFWDIQRDTDVARVFTEYEKTLADLQQRYPRVRFVHLTVPLVVRDDDWRAGIKRLLGRPIPRTLDNAKRHELSERLRARYGKSGSVFDLEALQAAASTENNIPYLDPALTSDGAHLNEAGRVKLAAGFLQAMTAQ